MRAKVAINSIVNRQTSESPYSHFEGTKEELLERVIDNIKLSNFTAGYRTGVILVEILADKFFTGLIKLEDGDILIGKFEARREKEKPRKSIQVKREEAKKQPANRVQIVCYSHDVLAENNEAETDADWEIVSLNAYPTREIAPIDPMTLMHNHFGSDGGTATNMNAKEFETQMRESFLYWRDKGILA